MKPVCFPLFTLAVFLAGAGLAAAEEKGPGLLTRPEVQQLVARAEPADHARLAVHFAALAERYAAEAKRHVVMSQSFVGNPNRSLGSGMSIHCTRLADLNNQEAATLRELVAYHEKLAVGMPVTLPRDGAPFQGGAGAPDATGSVTALAAKAGTPAEHKALEEYFLTLAKRYTAAAEEHVALAQTYRGTKIAQAAVMQDRLAGLDRETAKEATAAAGMHNQLATLGR